MSEDRRVTAPSTKAAEAAPTEADAATLPDDGKTPALPPVEPRGERDVPRDRPSQRRAGETPSARRVRARMTLRIPDDEVGRPSSSMAAAEPAEPPDQGQPIQGTRIISVGPPPMTDDEPVRGSEAPPPEPTRGAQREDSWTPYQPTVADGAPPTPRDGFDPDATGEYPAPSSEDIPVVDTAAEAPETTLDVAGRAGPSSVPPPPARAPSRPPVPSPSAPPVAHVSAGVLPQARWTAPAAEPVPPARAPMRAIHADAEGEDVRFEEDETAAPTLSQPQARPSEPGDAPEISVDDLVSVEALPKAAPVAASPPGIPPARPRAKSIPPPPPSSPPPAAAPSPAAPAAPAAQKGERARVVTPPTSSGLLAPPPLTEASAGRKRVRPWWEELFNDDFIRASAKVTDPQVAAETTFIEESLGVARDGVLLDLGCGTGLHAIELTKRGYHVVGFDLSLAMLARAADEAHDREARLNFVQGDMRDMTFDEQFDGVYCWGTSFGYFDEEKNAQVIARVHKALRPGGVFLLDVVNRDYIMKQSPSLAWFEGEGCICMDEMSIDWITSRLKVKRTMMMDDGRTKEIEYSIRVYALHELGRVLHEQGFRVAEVSGRTATPGVFFGCDSPRTMILAAKR